ncbi:hypothetical protein ALC53_05346 [Atta colombica]|uniref:Uncharacterized protein n=1 Tax=Atta colombica TaxID=520822 RepID=A0A195BJL6_9HYME|nr:hypothetical protein ALC53_05346 [Atta colombica]
MQPAEKLHARNYCANRTRKSANPGRYVPLTPLREEERKNEDYTSIESDKAACAAPVAFNEHSASQPHRLRSITWRFPQTAFAKLSSAKPREEVDPVYKQNWPLGIRSPSRGPPSTLLAFIAGKEPQL